MEARRFSELLFSDSTRLYCVLDGASVPDLPIRLYETDTPNFCLMRGELAPDVAFAAPYAAVLTPGSAFSNWVFENCSGKHWGIFLHCRFSLKEVRRHCRELFRVMDETGRPLIFRYYDPRVITRFLPTCEPAELETFFGRIETFFAENADGSALNAFRLEEGALKTTELV